MSAIGWVDVSIICYHDVDPAWDSPISVHPAVFARQMKWLATHRRVVSLAEAVRLMDERGRLPARVASVTFDDGFVGMHEFAMPVLLQEGLQATFFVVAGTLGTTNAHADWVRDAPRPRRTLSAAQVLELRDAGFEIGSHSFTHRNLTTLHEHEVVSDLRRSREVLEDLIERPVTLFAYPGGRHDEHARRAAATVGFQHSFSMADTDLPVALPHAIPRVGIYRGDGAATLRAKASPWFWRVRNSPLQPTVSRLARLRRRTG
jgi:peptidoglycan/xylan/chitin deacetylase (PgdA/CDA1 family)